MLVCNNCSTVNDDHVKKCVHCHMEGNFRVQLGESRSDAFVAVKEVPPCGNCGSHAPGEGSKCAHCHFPLPVQKPRIINVDEELPQFQNTSQKLK